MEPNKLRPYVIIILLLLYCNNIENNTAMDSSVADSSQAAKDSGMKDGDEMDVAIRDSENDALNARCPNGKVEELEECDDGDFDELNGCTSLCTYSCSDDRDCDDGDPCNGVESCDESHACDISDPDEPNGTVCDSMKTCWEGRCVDDVCGDNITTSDEECDDGDTDPNNGCTPQCRYTCKSDSDCEKNDQCSGAFSCDNEKHICTGEKLLDEAVCKMLVSGDDGWCQKGVCVPTNCGNGEKEGNEECDEGEANGTDDSSCLINCIMNRCGNGEIDPGEQCDDGNSERLDGCDPKCEWEFASRVMELNVVKDEAPDFCKHSGNRFGEAFPGNNIPFGPASINMLELINEDTKRRLDEGMSHMLIQILDSSDNTLMTSDDEITVGIFDAVPREPWPFTVLWNAYLDEWDKFIESMTQPPSPDAGPAFGIMPSPPIAPDPAMPIDFPFMIKSSNVEDDGTPAQYHSVVASQNGGGRVTSKEEANILLEQGFLGFDLYDYEMRIEFSTEKMSTPQSKASVSDELKLPETWGVDPDSDTGEADLSGIFCGALKPNKAKAPITSETIATVAGLEAVPTALPSLVAPEYYCCKSDGSGRYTACLPDGLDDEFVEYIKNMTTLPIAIAFDGNCDSEIDVLLDGCWICNDWTSGGSIVGEPSDCSLYQPGATIQPYCVEAIHAIDYDVDTDGDGILDAFSGVITVSGRRASLEDVTE